MDSGLLERCTCPPLLDIDLERVVRDGAVVPALVQLRTGVGCDSCIDELGTRIAATLFPNT